MQNNRVRICGHRYESFKERSHVQGDVSVQEDGRNSRVTPSVDGADVVDGGTVGNRFWLNSQPMPMIGRPCTCELEKLKEQIGKLPEKPSIWMWTNSEELVPSGMNWLRSNPDSHAASVRPELDSWILQNPKSWLVVDGRSNRTPDAGGDLEKILRELPVVVVMVVENVNEAQLFPDWDFPL